MFSKLQYISQGPTAAEQLKQIQAALDAGCTWIQLRWKGQPEQEVMDLAATVKVRCAASGATFIVNDNAVIAKAVDADGLHLGLSDMPVPEARKLLGNGKIIGGTANTVADVIQRAKEQCDYVGLGPFRFTTTKEKLSPVLGSGGYRHIIETLTAAGISIPVYAIGGIVLDDLDALMDTGIYGIAVSGLISKATSPSSLVQQLNQKLYAATTYSR